MVWPFHNDDDQNRTRTDRDTDRKRDAPYEELERGTERYEEFMGVFNRAWERDCNRDWGPDDTSPQEDDIKTEAVMHASGWLSIRSVDDDDGVIEEEWYASDLAVTVGDWR